MNDYPETIESKMELAYLPKECVEVKDVWTSSQYQIYCYTDEGILKYYIIQSTIDGVNSFINDKTGQITYIEINGLKGVLIEYDNGNFPYSLTWQDDH